MMLSPSAYFVGIQRFYFVYSYRRVDSPNVTLHTTNQQFVITLELFSDPVGFRRVTGRRSYT